MRTDTSRTERTAQAALLASLVLLMTGAGAAVQNPSYNGYVSLTLENTSYSPGDTLEASISAANGDVAPVVDGYLVVELVRGCEDPTYPSQDSDCDNVFHEERITDIDLAKGAGEDVSYTYELPDDLRSGTYRVDVYFRTERTPVSGIPHIFSAPSYRSFTVEGDGDYPALKISRTETVFTGTDEVKGTWDPETNAFETTDWPSIAGPVGVLVTDAMETVSGTIHVSNAGQATDGELELTVCEWDDTSCEDPVYQDTQDVEIAAGDSSLDVAVDAPQDPGAYAVRMELRADGRLHSLYRNRLIVEGETVRIRRFSVSEPYRAAGDTVSLRLVTGTSPDHYTSPTMRNLEATVTVEDLESGTTVMERSQEIGLLSRNRLIDARWFNATTDRELYRYRISATVRNSAGQVYDEYSYVVDASEFAGDVSTVSLESASYRDGSMEAEICGRSSAGVPAQFDAEIMLMDGNSLTDQSSSSINGCGSVTLSPVERQSYELLVNADRQYSFDVDLSEEVTPGEEQTNETDPGTPEQDDGQPVLLYAGLAVLVLLIVAVLYWRGRR